MKKAIMHVCLCVSMCVCHSVFRKEHPSIHAHTLTETVTYIHNESSFPWHSLSCPVFKITFHVLRYTNKIHGDRGLLNLT